HTTASAPASATFRNFRYNSITPMPSLTKKFIKSTIHLPVRNLRETLDYYRDVLGFHDEWTSPNADGKLTDGGIRRDDLRLLFGEDPDFVGSSTATPKAAFPCSGSWRTSKPSIKSTPTKAYQSLIPFGCIPTA